jgi:hypothetical protein
MAVYCLLDTTNKEWDTQVSGWILEEVRLCLDTPLSFFPHILVLQQSRPEHYEGENVWSFEKLQAYLAYVKSSFNVRVYFQSCLREIYFLLLTSVSAIACHEPAG